MMKWMKLEINENHWIAKINARTLSPADCLLLFFGLAYLAYLTLRAFLIPATIDEAYSILVYVPKSVWAILTYDYADPIANNHILNTLAIKFLTQIFGTNLLSARLANLMAGLLFTGAGIGLVLWLANPYLAEFFSIGRGYGMSIGLMAVSVCFAWHFFEKNRLRTFTASLVFAWLSVAANFTLLNYYACLSGIFLVFLWQNRLTRWPWPTVFFTAHVLLALLMYLPVTRMMSAGEFEKFGVTGFYQDTVQSFIRAFFYGKEFLGGRTFEVADVALPLFFGMAALMFFFKWIKTQFRWTSGLFMAALLPVTVAVNVAMTLATDAEWLPARTNSFFYPLLVLAFLMVGKWLVVTRFSRWVRPVLLVLAFSSGLSLNRSANLEQSREWWYDRDTLHVLDYLKNLYIQEKRTAHISFTSRWQFSLSFKFHLQSNWGGYAKYVQPEMPWRKIPEPEDDFEFFYGEIESFSQFSDRYEMVWVLEPRQRALFRRRQ
jgi:hypothetical protein